MNEWMESQFPPRGESWAGRRPLSLLTALPASPPAPAGEAGVRGGPGGGGDRVLPDVTHPGAVAALPTHASGGPAAGAARRAGSAGLGGQ